MLHGVRFSVEVEILTEREQSKINGSMSSSKGETTLRKRTPVEPEMPEDIRIAKEKREKETGKKYKYRPSKKDMPSISHMLAHGAPESEGRPRTWLELIGYPLLLALLFFITFIIFMNVVPTSKNRRHTLPKMEKQPGQA